MRYSLGQESDGKGHNMLDFITFLVYNGYVITRKDYNMTQQKIIELMKAGELDLYEVIDAVIAANGIIGVGKITLAEQVSDYIIRGAK